MVKAYNLPIDYVLYDMSYANMIMYGAVLPSYTSNKDKGKSGQEQEIIKVDDPKNRDRVKKIFEQFS
ncbi:hypothetical protein [Bacteroides sp.]|uniref:hypothetical protein n=1 Tax=Bacteroides sp. TaxID=29523 RepID=UPI002A81B7B5|nr:hypothetical protein [Bacteroides sp.]